MAEDYLERVAGELADLALADMMSSGDEKIIENISEILGASSQTLQEAYLTAVRVRRAEARARELLAKRAGTIKVGSQMITDGHATLDAEEVASDPIEMPGAVAEPTSEPVEEPQEPEEDDAFADVLNTLDEFLQADEEKPISPSRPSRK